LCYLPATRETGFLPDLDVLDEALLRRTVAMFLASPSDPQGAVADLTYLQRAAAMARRYGYLLFSDECYSEITRDPRLPAYSKQPAARSTTSCCSSRSPSVQICPGCA